MPPPDAPTPTLTQDLTAAEQRTKVIGKLHGILKPFVLRRVKADVAIDLPRKQEVVLYAQMTEEQKRLNQGLLQGTLAVRGAALPRAGREPQRMLCAADDIPYTYLAAGHYKAQKQCISSGQASRFMGLRSVSP